MEKKNFYIERFENWVSQVGQEKAIQRATENLSSFIIGRNFGESVQSYFDRNPDKKEYQIYIYNLRNWNPVLSKLK